MSIEFPMWIVRIYPKTLKCVVERKTCVEESISLADVCEDEWMNEHLVWVRSASPADALKLAFLRIGAEMEKRKEEEGKA